MFVLYKWWTKPLVFAVIFALFMLGYFGSIADPNFRSIVAKPDNVPITIMVISVMLCIWIGFRRAALNDSRLAAGLPLLEEDKDDKVLVWPDLVYTELICLVLATAGLIVWGIIAKAPLEQPANPGYAPNPAKAPWYFLGLQELLTMFHPMVAGVMLPGLGLVGLILAPYTDRNPSHKPEDRKFAISTFTIFIMSWAVLVMIGSFFRGPGQNFVFPWNAGLFFDL
jgi:quinol-cytochrome oxidoreductase complex cytochrome b subunit